MKEKQKAKAPLIIAGPCVAESWDLLQGVAAALQGLSRTLNFDLVFKASFDKANRSSSTSPRGPGLEQTLAWFERLKSDSGPLSVLTDVHEVQHIAPASRVCDWLQIPAFLCRQTDLLAAAAASGRHVNVKKGQFLAPGAADLILGKLRAAAQSPGQQVFAITERGTTFGYSDYVVDMRSFPIMAATQAPIIYDITHSVQRPTDGVSSRDHAGGDRPLAPALARAAAATGYVDGFFLEVHLDPSKALSDKETQLSIAQAESLLTQIIPIWHNARDTWRIVDSSFKATNSPVARTNTGQ